MANLINATAATMIKSMLAQHGDNFAGAVEWLETMRAQESYLAANGAKNIRAIAEDGIASCNLAIAAIRESIDHSEFFGAANDAEAIRLRLMVHVANLACDYQGRDLVEYLKVSPAPKNESRPMLWSELTESEQREAINRGFPREAGTRYITKIKLDGNQLQLVRWIQVKIVDGIPLIPVEQYERERKLVSAAADYAEFIMREGGAKRKRNYLTKEESANPIYAAVDNAMRGRVEQFETLSNVPYRIFAYLGKNGKVTTWQGDILGTFRVVSHWLMPNSAYTSRMYAVNATIGGKHFTGRGLGEGMCIALKVRKSGKRSKPLAN